MGVGAEQMCANFPKGSQAKICELLSTKAEIEIRDT